MAFDVVRFIPRGSFVLASTTLASYVFGLFRDRILARSFGASVDLDSYNAAFLVPDFLFNVLVASGIAAAAVPIFTELYRKNHTEAHAYMNSLLVSAVGVMMIAGILLGVFAPSLSFLVAPGLDEAGRVLVSQMMRILALSSLLFAASNAFGAMLVSQKRFLSYGLSPVVYNLGIIAGAIYLAPHFGIMGVAYGTVLGAALHVAVRFAGGVLSGWKWRYPASLWKTPEIKRTVSLMIPKMIGHPVEMLTFWVFTGLASFLAPGSITVLSFARNFQSVPVSLLGIAMSTAVFPALTEARLNSTHELKTLLYRTAGTIFLTSSLAALVLYAMRRPLIALLLGGGAFDDQAIARTAVTLGVFCLAIPTESLSHLFARAFYATQNTVIPVFFSVVSLAVAGLSAYMLIGKIGIAGLPLGFFLGSFVRAFGLWIFFMRKLSRQ